MALFKRKRQRRQEARSGPRRRKANQANGEAEPQTLKRLLQTAVFLLFASAIVLICFIGLKPTGPRLVEGQRSATGVVADISFNYLSTLATQRRVREAGTRVPRAFKTVMEPYEAFAEKMENWQRAFNLLEMQTEDLRLEAREEQIASFAEEVDNDSGYPMRAVDISRLLEHTERADRETIFKAALAATQEIYQQGIYLPAETSLALSGLTLDEARFELQQALTPLAPIEVVRSLFNLLEPGLKPNLVYDLERTEERIRAAEEAVEPVIIDIEAGETIIAAGSTVTTADLERLFEYRRALREASSGRFDIGPWLLERIILTLVVLFCGLIYLRVALSDVSRSSPRIVMTALIILINLALLRLVQTLANSTLLEEEPELVKILASMAPLTLAPLLIGILAGSRPAVLATLFIGVFHALMSSSAPIQPFLLALLAGLVTIYAVREVRQRSHVVQAGFLGGVGMAGFAIFMGMLNQFELTLILQQAGAGLLAGTLTGVIAVGLLPVFENTFKVVTQITLLELGDFNHPLLRRMQVEAPGSYHHSLMVSNLAESAAARIGANALACRVSALFHDIGKLVKPEYFTENQRGGINPHLAKNPSMSALVIKAHVKEGVALAREHRLPGIVQDIIRQHHGTSLIQYFYYAAVKQSKAVTAAPFFPDAPRIDPEEVDPNTYRYDGPKPDFLESALVFFADSCEAASRSLKKVTPLSVEELVDSIFADRLADGQLDDCPITYAQLKEIKNSFVFTLLNSLHSRIEYPKKESEVVVEPQTRKTEEIPAPPKQDQEKVATESKAESK